MEQVGGNDTRRQSEEASMTVRRSIVDEALLHRVYGEFLEMPGLRLTCQQAQRLWGWTNRPAWNSSSFSSMQSFCTGLAMACTRD
jgi:hypothetical protein